jgi:hypothetical protein
LRQAAGRELEEGGGARSAPPLSADQKKPSFFGL